MRRIVYGDGKPYFKTITWSDHRACCAKCELVDLERTASFVLACAEGSPLLLEHTIRLQAPAQRERESKVREWAKKAGVFKDA